MGSFSWWSHRSCAELQTSVEHCLTYFYFIGIADVFFSACHRLEGMRLWRMCFVTPFSAGCARERCLWKLFCGVIEWRGEAKNGKTRGLCPEGCSQRSYDKWCRAKRQKTKSNKTKFGEPNIGVRTLFFPSSCWLRFLNRSMRFRPEEPPPHDGTWFSVLRFRTSHTRKKKRLEKGLRL